MKTPNYALFIACAGIIVVHFGCTKQLKPNQAGALDRDTTGQNDLVATPFGLLSKSHVHRIENGTHIKFQNGHVLKVDSKGKMIEDYGLRTKPISGNNRITTQSESKSLPAQSPGTALGWITWAQWINTSSYPIKGLSATWAVPDAPETNDGQLIYIFDGLETASGSDIIQPVLQWGVSPAGGTSDWEIANWYVWGGTDAAYTDLISVSSGTSLTGGIQNYSESPLNGSYTYVSSFDGYPNSLLLEEGQTYNGDPIPAVPIQSIAVITLETYGVVNRTDYPDGFVGYGVTMNNVSIFQFNPATTPWTMTWTWTPQSSTAATFGEHTSVVTDNSEIYTPGPTGFGTTHYTYGEIVLIY
jgi:hypothetical protein